MTNLLNVPDNLPVPQDDGLTDHLPGMALPNVQLPATSGGLIDLSTIGGILVIYCYPRTGRPGEALPNGWDDIPGARGCTPQACSFRDHYGELQALGAQVFGLSTQTTDYQHEMVERLHIPFPVLSDADFALCEALQLPTFEVAGMRLIKRVTLIVRNGIIDKIHYPVFPTHSDPEWVISHLSRSSQDQR